MKKNDKLTVNVERLGMNGEGVAKVDGQVVFVPFVLPNEQAECIAVQTKNKFAILKALKIENASKDRVVAKCPYFKQCGGCDLQHASYNCQLNFKTNLVKETLKKVGDIDFNVSNCEGSALQYGYRNKASFPVREDNGVAKLGMFRVSSHKFVAINECPLQEEQINKLIRITNKWLKECRISAFNEINSHGLIKHIVARFLQDQILITVVATSKKVPNIDKYVKLLEQNYNKFGLNINVNNLNNNVILSNSFIHIAGQKQLECNDNDTKYQVSSASFYQVNNDIKDKMYNKVLSLIPNNATVIDAYSGAGLLSSKLAKVAKKVVAVEIVKQATENANQLMEQNGITNVQNINGDCAKELPKIVKQISNNSVIILDPPRKGCDKTVLDSILSTDVNKIIYIACSPISLARDLKILLASGKFKLTFVKPFDMFPQTKNVETLAVLEHI